MSGMAANRPPTWGTNAKKAALAASNGESGTPKATPITRTTAPWRRAVNVDPAELPEVVEDREHHLVHAGVPEGHLRLDTSGADDPESGCDVNGVLDQRGLPDACRAGEHERAALPTLRVREERVDCGALGGATHERTASTRAVDGRHGASVAAPGILDDGIDVRRVGRADVRGDGLEVSSGGLEVLGQ